MIVREIVLNYYQILITYVSLANITEKDKHDSTGEIVLMHCQSLKIYILV